MRGDLVGGEQDEGLWVGLADAVNGVRAELESAQSKARADKPGLLFEVGSVEMEFAVDISEDRNSSTGVDVRVLSLQRARRAGLTESHRLKISMVPKDGRTLRPARISDGDQPELPPR
jgi:hypothetical protein